MNNPIFSKHFIIEVLRDKSVMLNGCVRDGNVDAFLEMRKDYLEGIERVDVLESELDSDYLDPVVGMDEEQIQVEIEQIKSNITRWETVLSNNVAGDRYMLEYKKSNDLRAYLNSVRDYTLQYHLEMPIVKLIFEETELAAVYFVIQAFGGVDANYNVSYEDFQKVKEDLKTSRLADYLDRICKDARTPHIKDISKGEQLVSKLEQISNETGQKKYIKKKPVAKGKSNEPVLVYVDTDAYNITQEEIDKILETYQVALVVRSSKAFVGLQTLNEDLHLSANMEGLRNEYKY